MLARFTEKSRRVVFFARYEAAQSGSTQVETHHLLLALFREDRELMRRSVGTAAEVDSIRQKLEQQFAPVQQASSVDLPMSEETGRVLAKTNALSGRAEPRELATACVGHVRP